MGIQVRGCPVRQGWCCWDREGPVPRLVIGTGVKLNGKAAKSLCMHPVGDVDRGQELSHFRGPN